MPSLVGISTLPLKPQLALWTSPGLNSKFLFFTSSIRLAVSLLLSWLVTLLPPTGDQSDVYWPLHAKNNCVDVANQERKFIFALLKDPGRATPAETGFL